MINLLNQLGLSEQMVPEWSEVTDEEISKKLLIDFSATDDKLNTLRSSSMNFLRKALS
jgi:hypothetical protein